MCACQKRIFLIHNQNAQRVDNLVNDTKVLICQRSHRLTKQLQHSQARIVSNQLTVECCVQRRSVSQLNTKQTTNNDFCAKQRCLQSTTHTDSPIIECITNESSKRNCESHLTIDVLLQGRFLQTIEERTIQTTRSIAFSSIPSSWSWCLSVGDALACGSRQMLPSSSVASSRSTHGNRSDCDCLIDECCE